MCSFVLNFIKVRSDRSGINLYRLTSASNVNLTLLTRIINQYSKDYVVTPLTRDYGDLKRGIYVTELGKSASLNENTFRRRLEELIRQYEEVQKWKDIALIPDKGIDVSKIELDVLQNVSPYSYVVARLLNKAIEKLIPQNLMFSRIGEEVIICLNYNYLEKEFWSKGINHDDRFKSFCESYPGLCGTINDDCAKFFLVVKCLTPRFQHVVSENRGEEIYLIIHSYYRRFSNLDLTHVLDYVIKKGLRPDVLNGVRVNYRIDGNDTLICDIESIDNSIVKLRCDEASLSVNLKDLGQTKAILLNPSFRSSRKFIAEHLCKDFDRHRDLNMKYPSEYFKVLRNDVEIFKKIIDEICLGGTCYSIGSEFKRIGG